MAKKRVVIDLGHGTDTYPPFKGVPQMPEFEFNNAVGKLAESMLEYQGLSVLLSQPFDSNNVSLSKRVNLINSENRKSKIECTVSIHADFNNNPDTKGHWVFYWNNSSNSKRLAEIWSKHGKELSNPSRGIMRSKLNSWTNFMILRETHTPAILIEHAFMSNKDDIKLLLSDKFRKESAIAITKAVCEYCDVDFKESNIKQDTNTASDLIKHGSRGFNIEKLQSDLYNLGFTIVGKADGIAGDNTITAIELFQAKYGLDIDGMFGKDSYSKLEEILSIGNKNKLVYNRLLKQGNKGNDVEAVQGSLNRHGYDPNGIDGIFGKGTRNAVIAFQRANGLDTDGLVGRSTIAKLNGETIKDVPTTPSKPIIKGQYEIIKPNRQTTIVKIPRNQIDEIDVIVAKSNVESIKSMQKRTNSDFVLNGGLFFWQKGKAHSMNLLIDDFKQNNAGTYSRFGLMVYGDKSFKFGKYAWTPNLKEMLGGSPLLLQDGQIKINKGTMSGSLITSRHPRSALGMNDDYVFLVVIDGRSTKTYLYGMTIDELAKYMQSIGCKDAMNLDGGYSTQLYQGQKLLNQYYNGRSVHNAIGIKLKTVLA